MVSIRGKFCIDRYEASTVELLDRGKTRKHSPFKPVAGLRVKAVSKKGAIPQAHISRDQAEEACQNAGKRLCTDEEWVTTCKGKRPTMYPYGDEYKAGYCNDKGVSSFNHYYGPAGGGEPSQDAYAWENMNDARLNQMTGTLSPAGTFKRCRSGFQVYDLVGNLHEWTAAPSGTFRGGYYLDTHQNGDGCDYKTTAHSPKYYDYSTGFRCCK
jgi:formylglycine-generating enzyme required for sulfatase activity